MKQSRRIDPLLNRAQETEDAAARVLAERQSVLAQHEAQLVELRRYAEEYGNSQMSATSPAQLANRRAFLDRLQSAVEQQTRAVDNSRQTVEIERGRLLLAIEPALPHMIEYTPDDILAHAVGQILGDDPNHGHIRQGRVGQDVIHTRAQREDRLQRGQAGQHTPGLLPDDGVVDARRLILVRRQDDCFVRQAGGQGVAPELRRFSGG